MDTGYGYWEQALVNQIISYNNYEMKLKILKEHPL